jgi:predicted nucleic acid-binding protein
MGGARGLIDTGAILALLDKSDRWHERCVSALRDLPLPLGTSAACLAELFHLLDPHAGELEVAWRFLHSGVVTVLPIDDADLAAIESLMKRYYDQPMDFADATLVHLARRESLATVFTVDRTDFETYRISGRQRFRIFPEW